MTREEFLNFDMSIFEKEEYKNEKKYLSAITTFLFIAMEDKKNKHKRKISSPNACLSWFDEKIGIPLSKKVGSDIRGERIESHKKANEFIAMYEESCKKYLRAYDSQYAKICEPNDSKFYTANLTSKLANALFNKRNNGTINRDELLSAGYVDFRLAFEYSLDKNGNFIENKYEEHMIDLYMSLEKSLNSLISNVPSTNKDHTKA